MSERAYELKTTEPGLRNIEVVLLGTGAADPTVQEGDGVTCARQSAGVYRLSFTDDPGNFKGLNYGLYATTPGNIAGHTVVATGHTAKSGATSAYIDIYFYNASDAVHDLAAAEYICLSLKYTHSGL